jgi:hypothetical protein
LTLAPTRTYPTCQTVSSTVPSTHFTTATGFSPNFGRAG